ncbi:3,4-dihydroxy-2-butanone-4-phosphate synthase [Formosimonas limnophila]|uniref:3,4-dihydroxy-2-butanone 4-phosphate synthase n=2 Tax=Formosimonas limnophila TaxID=1384487 RepID=A0A8J3CM14_9BURK|nr:3,4-dihydroxy-2-butanone-4-phosphate synthase [Formosimonas limnophila]
MTMSISPTSEIVEEIKAGRMVILVDEEDRENEGDVILAADFVTPEAINFMAKHCRGLVCLTLTQARCDALGLNMMVSDGGNGTQFGTNFTVSIEAKEGVTTGISAADRALTIKVAAGEQYTAADIVQPGHVFPVRAVEGGVLVRAGHTEAGCDLAALAGLTPASVICEIMKDDGEMARLPDLMVFAQEHGLKIGTITDLIAYRSQKETLIQRVGEREMQTAQGLFHAIAYKESCSDNVHLVLTKGDVANTEVVPVRVHEPLSVLDVLDVAKTTHSVSLDAALKHIEQEGVGVAVLLNCQESSARLTAQFSRLNAQERGEKLAKKAPTELLLYGIGAQILKDVGVQKMMLLGSPRKMPSMGGFGLEVVGFSGV